MSADLSGPGAPSTTFLDVRAQSIPAALRALLWVLWRAEPRPGGKPAKVPYRIADPDVRAASTGPTTWGTFEDALAGYQTLVGRPHPRGPVAGIGVVLTAGAQVVCLDLDHVVTDARQLDPRAQRIEPAVLALRRRDGSEDQEDAAGVLQAVVRRVRLHDGARAAP